MMHLMHPRGDQQPPQPAILIVGQPDITMVKEDHRKGNRFIEQELRHGDAQEGQDEQPRQK